MSPWIVAARLKTLPLAAAGILLGSAMAYKNHSFNPYVFLFGLLTAFLLQILSNYANDYGDFIKGTDQKANRKDRMLSAGKINPHQMKIALILLTILTLLSGSVLLSSAGFHLTVWIGFFVIGLISIAAALYYSIGKHAFGYSGKGDIAVLLFFGLISVSGIYFIHSKNLILEVFISATGCGMLSTGVLNVNNIRDIKSDKENNKLTIPVKIGIKNAFYYHIMLCICGLLLIILGIFLQFQLVRDFQLLLLILLLYCPLFYLIIRHLKKIKSAINESISYNYPTIQNEYNVQLKALSLIALFACLMYFIFVLFI